MAERRLRPRRGYSGEVMAWEGDGDVVGRWKTLGFDFRMVASTTGMIESIALIPFPLAHSSEFSSTISSSLNPSRT